MSSMLSIGVAELRSRNCDWLSAKCTFCSTRSHPANDACLVEDMSIMALQLDDFVVIFEIFEAD